MTSSVFAMTADQMDDVAVVAAQQKAMERSCLFLPHGCRLFTLERGWESATVQRDRHVACCDTLLDLEASLCNSETKVIFVPIGALMTDQDIEKVCQRNGVTKTLFREVEKS